MRSIWIFLMVLTLAGCSGAEDRKAAYFEKGKTLYASADFEKARLEIKKVLKIDPEDVEARMLLADIFEELGDYPNAAQNYWRVVNREPGNLDSRLRLGQLYLLGRQVDRARPMAAESLVLSPDHPGALTMRATIRVHDGEVERAFDDLKRALASHPGYPDAVSLMSSLLHTQGKTSEAIDAAREGIALNPENLNLRVVLASAYAYSGNTAEAAKAFEDILGLDPDNVGARIRVARFYDEFGRRADAERVLRDGIERQPADTTLKLSLVELLMRQDKAESAERELKGFIAQAPDDYTLKFGLGNLYEQSSASVEAAAVYEQIIAAEGKNANGLLARNRLALIRSRDNREDDALELLSEVLKENPLDKSALVLRSAIALERQRPEEAIVDLRTVVRDHPNDAQVLQMIGRAHWANEEPMQAKHYFAKAARAAPNEEAPQLLLVRTLLSLGDVDDAQAALEVALAREPSSRSYLEVLVRLKLRARQWDEAVDLARIMRSRHPDWFLADYMEGVAEHARGNHAQAVTLLERARGVNADSLETLTALLRAYIASDNPAAAQVEMSKALQSQPGSAALLNLQGELLVSNGRQDEAIGYFENAINTRPDWGIPYRNLAGVYESANDDAAAVDIYTRGIKATGSASPLMFALANRYERLGEHELAIAQYDAVVEREPHLLTAANNLAMLLLTYRDDEESVQRAEELTQAFVGSTNPDYLDTLAWTYVKSGRPRQAIEILESIVLEAPQMTEYRYHLGIAYHSIGDSERATQQLRAALGSDTPFRGSRSAQDTLEAIEGG